MTDGVTDRVERLLLSWSRMVRRRARLIVLLLPVVVGLLGWYSASTLRVDTDTSSLVSDELPYRQIYNAFQDAFPGGADQLVVVVEASTPGLADRAARILTDAVRADSTRFVSVYAPGIGPFWDRHGLLYMSTDSLAALVDRVDASADILRDLDGDPTLAGLTRALRTAFDSDSTGGDGSEQGADLGPVLGLLTASVFAASEGRFAPVPWSAFLDGKLPTVQDLRRTMTITPRLSFQNRVPGLDAIERLRVIIDENGLVERNGVHVRLTGSVAIEAEELTTAVAGVRQAGFLALASVALILFLALRSVRLIMAALVTLGAGLVTTAAVAAATVGSLNLISVAFGVLYIGLGIDYAIHLCLRYRGRRAQGLHPDAALDAAVCEVGPSLMLSALTTAACFFAFLPTDFTGVSELGLIGGNGMFVSLFVTLTVLPALIAVFPPNEVTGVGSGGLPRLGHAIATWRRPILGLTAVGTAAALFVVPGARFDYNPLNLRDPASESVVAYRALLADSVAKPQSISVLRTDPAGIAEVAAALEGSPVVEGTRSILDFVPRDQEVKLELLSGLAGRLGSPPDAVAATSPAVGAPAATVAGSIGDLQDLVNEYRWRGTPDEASRAQQLFHVLRGWERRVEAWPEPDRTVHLRRLEAALVGALSDQVRRLRETGNAGPVTIAGLPDDLRERWIGTAGQYRVEIVPAEPLVDNERLWRYADDVRERVPDATGEAVSELETGRVAAGAFRNALALAGLATVIILLALQRNLRVVAYVVVPLILAGIWTAATTAVLDLPFNFANVIALPLLLGVGVDNGIHMVHQARVGRRGQRDPMAESTSRAVLFATLTTMASFGNLAFALHVGMASMGRLLTVGMTCVLVATLIVLPALLLPTTKATEVE